MGVFLCGSMKPSRYCTYPCRGILHTPRNAPRRRFGPKIGRVLGVSLLGKVKSDGFFTYPYRGVLHTLPNVLRRRFGPKTGLVLGLSLLGRVKPGAFLVGTRAGSMELAKFFTYPCRGVLHTPRNAPRRRFRPKTGRVLGVSLLGKVKSGAFLAYSCGEI